MKLPQGLWERNKNAGFHGHSHWAWASAITEGIFKTSFEQVVGEADWNMRTLPSEEAVGEPSCPLPMAEAPATPRTLTHRGQMNGHEHPAGSVHHRL